ncbi:MAG: hypothetical protein JWN21_718 [Sphingomonas bacterium]|uniref:hypothetical protein n=1 Tax=Sphingomonas bacterium TaxID=1895847 RepID=UPI0026045BBB|nr:hypothetical protein [Sphingomonas bacterium]MDB5695175.1 hypothetical protein [Sphingomonas bacterium]
MATDPHPMPPEAGPGEASAEAGVVMLDGPDGVAVAMSPDAAEETGRRLIAAAKEARSQGRTPAD